MKSIKFIILFAVLLCLTTGCQSGKQNIDFSAEENNFETGVSDTFSVPINDITSLLNGEITGYVYFSRETCPICLVVNAYISTCLSENCSPVIYKFDTDVWRENEKFQIVLDQYGVETIPTLIKIYEDGTFVVFESTAETEEDFIKDLNSFLDK